MIGRESKQDNDLFFTCSLIEYIARKTKNNSRYVVNTLGKGAILKIYKLADVYHSDNIDRVTDDFVNDYNLETGEEDYFLKSKYTTPTHFDIGKVYKRLIKGIAKAKGICIMDALFFAYNSEHSDKINDYNCAFYYDTPDNITNTFLGINMLGCPVTVIVDRPKDSTHPRYNDIVYELNYGYVKEFPLKDNKYQEAYIMGADEIKKDTFDGFVIAVIHRKDTNEDKWVVANRLDYTKEEIIEATKFIEMYFEIEITTTKIEE